MFYLAERVENGDVVHGRFDAQHAVLLVVHLDRCLAERVLDRLLSAYRMNDGRKLWIITESDRSATTLLLPEEY